jgi:hypothetical protein
MRRSRIVFAVIFVALSAGSLRAQVINGSSFVTMNDIKTYTFDNHTVYSPYNWWFGNDSGAQVQSQSVVGTTYSITVQWVLGGSNSVNFSPHGTTIASLNITVACTTFPPAPTNGVSGVACGTSGTATISATPGSGGSTLWWYTSRSGGSVISIGTSYTAGQGTYYAATYSSTTGCASSSRLTVPITTATPPQLPTGGSAARVCTPGQATLTATQAQDGQLIWYDNNTTGTHSSGSLGSGSPLSLSNSSVSTFYMGSFSPANGCETPPSLRVSVTTVVNQPAAPTSVTGGTKCGAGVVTLSATPGWNADAIHWYSNSTGGRR